MNSGTTPSSASAVRRKCSKIASPARPPRLRGAEGGRGGGRDGGTSRGLAFRLVGAEVVANRDIDLQAEPHDWAGRVLGMGQFARSSEASPRGARGQATRLSTREDVVGRHDIKQGAERGFQPASSPPRPAWKRRTTPVRYHQPAASSVAVAGVPVAPREQSVNPLILASRSP